MTKQSTSESYRVVSIELQKAKAALAQHELARRRGEFIERSQVSDMLAARAAALSKAHAIAARRLAAQVTGMLDQLEVQEIIRTELERIQWEAYGRGPGDDVSERPKHRTRPNQRASADGAVEVRAPPVK